MTIDNLKFELQQATPEVIVELSFHIAKATFPRQSFCAVRNAISTADKSQIAKKGSRVPVTYFQEIGIEYRVTQARVNQAVSDIVHV